MGFSESKFEPGDLGTVIEQPQSPDAANCKVLFDDGDCQLVALKYINPIIGDAASHPVVKGQRVQVNGEMGTVDEPPQEGANECAVLFDNGESRLVLLKFIMLLFFEDVEMAVGTRVSPAIETTPVETGSYTHRRFPKGQRVQVIKVAM